MLHFHKIDANGNLIDDASITTHPFTCGSADIASTQDGGFIIGSCQDDPFPFQAVLMKISEDYLPEWTNFYQNTYSVWFNSVVQAPDSGYAAVGTQTGEFLEDHDVFLVKTTASGISNRIKNVLFKSNTISIFPNPVNGTATLHIQGLPNANRFVLYNLYGQKIGSQNIDGNSAIELTNFSLTDNLYLYQIISRHDQIASGKLVIIND
ncbi:MAG: T9SS type A sorting domain-containing protein [Bacteroidetes bacterium]|nr:T9SS type A sorting domain-containing protein [Bacteroidota bacterium]